VIWVHMETGLIVPRNRTMIAIFFVVFFRMRVGVTAAGAAGLGNDAALNFAVDKAGQARVDNWTWVAL
jgi:hypothetical protein